MKMLRRLTGIMNGAVEALSPGKVPKEVSFKEHWQRINNFYKNNPNSTPLGREHFMFVANILI